MSFVKGLKCRECGHLYPTAPLFVCEYCFGPLEVDYNYDEIKTVVSKQEIAARPANIWRYKELLPLDHEPSIGPRTGFTPLINAKNLAKVWGVKELYIKDDSVSHPTLSFKDRVVAVAVSKAKEFGFDTLACASTGNLANAVAAFGAQAGMNRYVFIPADLEIGKVVASQVYQPRLVKVEGDYDQVNRLCSQLADKYQWAFVNINIRPFYAEGSKTYGYEIAEQLGWQTPQHIVVPVAGGSLLSKIGKAFKELSQLGLTDGTVPKIYAAQAQGCAPVVTAVHNGTDAIRPVKANTIAKSLAIGNPADGYYAYKTVTESGGWGEAVTDQEIVAAIELLASTEGIFTETAGGVTVAATQKLIETNNIPRNESIVICVTGNGLKTVEAVQNGFDKTLIIGPSLAQFDAAFSTTKN